MDSEYGKESPHFSTGVGEDDCEINSIALHATTCRRQPKLYSEANALLSSLKGKMKTNDLSIEIKHFDK